MPAVSIVIPTYNERAGIGDLLERICGIFKDARIDGEVLIVDDNSPDGTADVVEDLGTRLPVRVLRRPGKLGLSSAVIDGFAQCGSEILGCMDADLSHDPAIIPALVEAVRSGRADLAVGSRYVAGGGIRDWPLKRRIISKVAVIMGSCLTPVKDITSGYFFLRRSVIEGVHLNPIGFKIGLEIVIKGKYRSVTEVPYVFTDRAAGNSKFNAKEVRNYLVQLLDLIGYRIKHGRPGAYVPPQPQS